MAKLIFVDAGATSFEAICDECQRETPAAPAEELTISGEIPLDRDECDGFCARGHHYEVVREVERH